MKHHAMVLVILNDRSLMTSVAGTIKNNFTNLSTLKVIFDTIQFFSVFWYFVDQ